MEEGNEEGVGKAAQRRNGRKSRKRGKGKEESLKMSVRVKERRERE